MAVFELMEFRDPAFEPGERFPGTQETVIGTYDREEDAIAEGRRRWQEFRGSDSRDVAWWIVRVPGESLARWIADGGSATERVLDLTTNTLVEFHP